MKKLHFIIFICIFALLLTAPTVFAQEAVNASSTAGIFFEDNRIDNSTNITDNPRQHTGQGQMGLPMPLHPFVNEPLVTITVTEETVEALPASYTKDGWEVWDDYYFTQNDITIDMMKGMRNRWLSQHVTGWKKLGKEYAKTPIDALTKFPARSEFAPDAENQVQIIGFVTTKGRDDKQYNLEESILEALHHAKINFNATRVIVLKNRRFHTVAKVAALGTVIGGSSIIAQAGSPDGVIVSGAAGSGIGKSTSYVERIPFIKIIVFNADPTKAPPAE